MTKTTNKQDPVEAWAESIDLKPQDPKSISGRKMYRHDGRQTVIVPEEYVAFFYHAQQRAVLEARIDEAHKYKQIWNIAIGVFKPINTDKKVSLVQEYKNTLTVFENRIAELEAQLQLMEGK